MDTILEWLNEQRARLNEMSDAELDDLLRRLEAAHRLIAGYKSQPCGHPQSAIISTDEGTHYCGECAK